MNNLDRNGSNFLKQCIEFSQGTFDLGGHWASMLDRTRPETRQCYVPKMNATIREKFIDLHENRDEITGEPKYILTELDEALRSRYSEEQVADLPAIPQYGDLDLSRVRESDYFFS